MRKIPLALSNRRRDAAKEPLVALKNRFVEQNPVLSDNDPAFVQRPGLKYWDTVGEGPIRAIFQQPGAFNDDAFCVSYDTLFRLDRTNGAEGGNRAIFTGLIGPDNNTTVNMTVTGDIGGGEIPPRLFFCDGAGLYVYSENSFSTNILNVTGPISDGDVVQVGGIYYRLSSSGLDTGTPAGTSGNPWRVLSTGTLIQVVTRLYKAINASGEAGVDYSTALTENTAVVATFAGATSMGVRAKVEGSAGNGISCTETGVNLAWDNTTTTGGGAEGVIQIPTPEEVGVIDVVQLNNFVFVIPAQGEGLNGRFYWIRPGELSIDGLDFATAERSADPINAVEVFNDQLWLLGQNTTEVWYMTGNADSPVQRLEGVVFDRGVHQGTAVQVKDSVVLMDSFGGIFVIQNGEQRISTPDIEEICRKAIALQGLGTI